MIQDPTPTPEPVNPIAASTPESESERPSFRDVGVGPVPPGSGSPGSSRTAGWWVALGILCYLLFGLQLMQHTGSDELPDPAKYSSVQLKLVGRYIIGAKEWGLSVEASSPQIDDLASANTIDGLRAAVVIAELLGPSEGLERLDVLDATLDASDDEGNLGLQEDSLLVRRLLTIAATKSPDDAPADENGADAEPATEQNGELSPTAVEPLNADERNRLIERHGWFGELAISQAAPEGDASRAAIASGGVRTLIILGIFAIVGGGAILVGFALFIIAGVMIGSGRIRRRYPLVQPQFTRPTTAFLETAVLFLGLFIALQVILGLVSLVVDIESVSKPLTTILVWLVALIAFWPLARGVSFGRLRAAYGWHANGAGMGGVFREIAMGVVGYVAGLPIVVTGILITLALMMLTSAKTTHPIQSDVEIRSFTDAIYLYLLAAVWAPFVEETIFRGAMFHHLRQWTGLLATAFATAFAFAIIHPQGYAGVPVLMALAINFALMREWRGSLIASITAHALHNGAIVTMLILVLA